MLVQGTASNDTLIGGVGNDTLIGYQGNDSLVGGAGTDTAQFMSLAEEYVVTRFDTHITSLHWSSGDGSDTLVGVEFLQYADKRLKADLLVLGEGAIAQETTANNNTWQTAQLLTSPKNRITGNISSSSDRDFFRLNITQPTDIEVRMSGLSSNLSMRLWNDFNGNGRIDAGESHTAFQSGLAQEYLFRADRWAGAWYVEVWGGAASPYILDINTTESIGSAPSTAKNLGVFSNGQSISQSSTIGSSDPQDHYKFTLTQKSKVVANLSFLDNYGDAFIEIYNPQGQRLAIADNPGIPQELLTAKLDPGDYYIKVQDWQGLSESIYSLDLQFRKPVDFFVNPAWAGTAYGADPDGAGPAEEFGIKSFASLQSAIDVATDGDEIEVAAGDYGDITINKAVIINGINANVRAATITAGASLSGLNYQLINMLNTSGVNIENGAIANPITSDGIYASGASFSLKNLSIVNYYRSIALYNSQAQINGLNISGAYSGFVAFGSQVNGSGVSVSSSGGNGAYLDNSVMKLSGSSFSGQGIAGINSAIELNSTNINSVLGSDGIYTGNGSLKVFGGSISGYYRGINSHGSSLDITGLSINNVYSGITAYSNSSVVASSNNIVGDGDGIYIENSNGILNNNDILVKDRGIAIINSSASQITGNTSKGRINFYTNSLPSLSNNDFSQVATWGIYSEQLLQVPSNNLTGTNLNHNVQFI